MLKTSEASLKKIAKLKSLRAPVFGSNRLEIENISFRSIFDHLLCYASFRPLQGSGSPSVRATRLTATPSCPVRNISYKERLIYVNLLPVCYWHELLDLIYFYKATHNMIHLDPSVVPFVRDCARMTRISVTCSQSFVPKRCRTSTIQKSFFIRTTRIWNLLITRFDLENVTFGNFKSVLYGYYSQALAINYDPDSPRSFKSIYLKCNTARFLDQEISCCM